KRNAELSILVKSKRRTRKIGKLARDLFIRDWLCRDLARLAGIGALRQELQRAGAIPPDGGKQAIRIDAVRAAARGNAAANVMVVGQKVVEHGNHRIAGIAVLAQRQRERDRKRVLPI